MGLAHVQYDGKPLELRTRGRTDKEDSFKGDKSAIVIVCQTVRIHPRDDKNITITTKCSTARRRLGLNRMVVLEGPYGNIE